MNSGMEVRVEVTPRIRGAFALAKSLGVSPTFVWRVSKGLRKSRRVQNALAKCGVMPPPIKEGK